VPEVPELKHSRDVLRNIIVGKSIARLLTTSSGRYSLKQPEGMSEIINDLPLQVEAIDTKGKFMWWTLTGQDKTWYMWCTYGMSGQWSRTASKHAAFITEYNDSGSLITREQQKLFFNDQRRFGTIKFVDDFKKHQKKLASLGPDVLGDPPIDPEIFAKKILLKPQRKITEALMDQSGVAGIGNYIKSEALLRAGISPWRNVTDITSEEYVNLCQSVLDVATESYKSQGASIKTYRNVDDSKGTTQFNFKIYSKKVCPIGHPVINETTTDGRTSWWCKQCQK
jgi:formamidopyrimidine-DNA glycosylase